MKKCLKIISILLIFVFTVQTLVWADPAFVYKVNVPEAQGKVRERWKSGDNASFTIVHIQDAHVSLEAQLNIADIIQTTGEQDFVSGAGENKETDKTVLVAVEGAVGELKTDIYKEFPIHDVRKTVVKEYLKKGIFSGAEYSAITSESKIELFGAEDKDLFETNFKEYYMTISGKEKVNQCIEKYLFVINNLKRHICSEEYMRFEKLQSSYDEQPEYVIPQICSVLKKYSLDIENYPALLKLLENVENDSNTFSVDEEFLMADVARSIKDIKHILAVNDNARILIEYEDYLNALKKISLLKVIPQEINSFRDISKEISIDKIYDFLKTNCDKFGVDFNFSNSFEDINNLVLNAESFYSNADERSKVLLKNTLKRMKQKGLNKAFLVAGGYHSAVIGEECRRQGINYLTIAPSIKNFKNNLPHIEKMTGNLFPINLHLTSNITGQALYLMQEKNRIPFWRELTEHEIAEAICLIVECDTGSNLSINQVAAKLKEFCAEGAQGCLVDNDVVVAVINEIQKKWQREIKILTEESKHELIFEEFLKKVAFAEDAKAKKLFNNIKNDLLRFYSKKVLDNSKLNAQIINNKIKQVKKDFGSRNNGIEISQKLLEKFRNIKCVVWDIEGVLIDIIPVSCVYSSVYMYNMIMQGLDFEEEPVLNETNMQEGIDFFMTQILGQNSLEVIPEVIKQAQAKGIVIERTAKEYYAYYNEKRNGFLNNLLENNVDAVLMEHVQEVLSYLTDKGIQMHIASRMPEDRFKLLQKTGIFKNFQSVSVCKTIDDKVSAIKRIIDEQQLAEDEVLFVDDSSKVVKLAREVFPDLIIMGMPATYSDEIRLDEMGADLVVRDLSFISEIYSKVLQGSKFKNNVVYQKGRRGFWLKFSDKFKDEKQSIKLWIDKWQHIFLGSAASIGISGMFYYFVPRHCGVDAALISVVTAIQPLITYLLGRTKKLQQEEANRARLFSVLLVTFGVMAFSTARYLGQRSIEGNVGGALFLFGVSVMTFLYFMAAVQSNFSSKAQKKYGISAGKLSQYGFILAFLSAVFYQYVAELITLFAGVFNGTSLVSLLKEKSVILSAVYNLINDASIDSLNPIRILRHLIDPILNIHKFILGYSFIDCVKWFLQNWALRSMRPATVQMTIAFVPMIVFFAVFSESIKNLRSSSLLTIAFCGICCAVVGQLVMINAGKNVDKGRQEILSDNSFMFSLTALGLILILKSLNPILAVKLVQDDAYSITQFYFCLQLLNFIFVTLIIRFFAFIKKVLNYVRKNKIVDWRKQGVVRNERIIRTLIRYSKSNDLEIRELACRTIIEEVAGDEYADLRLQSLKKLLPIILPKIKFPRDSEHEVDLHSHTYRSDAYQTPAARVLDAFEEGLSIFSVTDHRLMPENEAKQAADIINGEIILWNKNNEAEVPEIVLLPGAELNVIANNKEVHLVSIFPDWYDSDYQKRKKGAIDILQNRLAAANREIIKIIPEITENINNFFKNEGHPEIFLTEKDLQKVFRNQMYTSLTADALWEKYKDSHPDIMKKYDITGGKQVWYNVVMPNKLKPKNPAYKKELFDLNSYCDIVEELNAKFMIAHPNEVIDKQEGLLEFIIEEFARQSLDGEISPNAFLGIAYYSHKVQRSKYKDSLKKYIEKLNANHPFYKHFNIKLLPESDSHGVFSMPANPLGHFSERGYYPHDKNSYSAEILDAVNAVPIEILTSLQKKIQDDYKRYETLTLSDLKADNRTSEVLATQDLNVMDQILRKILKGNLLLTKVIVDINKYLRDRENVLDKKLSLIVTKNVQESEMFKELKKYLAYIDIETKTYDLNVSYDPERHIILACQGDESCEADKIKKANPDLMVIGFDYVNENSFLEFLPKFAAVLKYFQDDAIVNERILFSSIGKDGNGRMISIVKIDGKLADDLVSEIQKAYLKEQFKTAA